MKEKFLDIENQLTKPNRDRIKAVGVELEGGWKKLPPNTTLTRDGSVQFANVGIPGGPAHVGEMPSTPMEVKDVEPWMRTFYPSHVNSTCGLHVHMSFKKALTYQQLMDPAYGKTVLEFLRRWAEREGLPKNRIEGDGTVVATGHTIWDRLEGKVHYCTDAFHADAQARATSKQVGSGASRYTAINYCYRLHSTVECRVLPMFETVDQAIRAVQELFRITNAFLVVKAAREELHSINIADDGGTHQEEIIECV